jgi:hypothetical protein
MVAEKFFGPAVDLVDLAVVFKDLLYCATVAAPIKVRAPKLLVTLTDRSRTGADFADKGMIMVLAIVAPARAKANRSEAGAVHQEVEEIVATRFENG